MARRATRVQLPALTPPEAPAEKANPAGDPLALRVQRLEDAVAALQDKSLAEEHVLERVQGLLRQDATQASAPVPRAPVTEHVRAAAQLPAALPNTDPLPLPAAVDPRLPIPSRHWTRPWLLMDLFAELRAMTLMFFDRTYRTAWTTRLALFAFVPLILLSHWWFPFAWLPFIGSVVDKLVDLVLAFFLYKVLAREAQRYQESSLTRVR